jgi:transcriptional regulator with XRE-family HTH domain
METGKKRNEELRKSIAGRLREIRKTLGLTQAELAEKLNISKPTYVRYEAGEIFPSLFVIVGLKEFFNINLNWLVTEVGEMFVDKENAISPEMHEKIFKDSKYLQLIDSMQVPVVEQVIFAKLFELRRLFKEEIDKLWVKKTENLPKTR